MVLRFTDVTDFAVPFGDEIIAASAAPAIVTWESKNPGRRQVTRRRPRNREATATTRVSFCSGYQARFASTFRPF